MSDIVGGIVWFVAEVVAGGIILLHLFTNMLSPIVTLLAIAWYAVNLLDWFRVHKVKVKVEPKGGG